jgi:hypothetical protein
VCRAGGGALIGSVIGGAGGIALGILAAVAIGCATVILCVFAILAAFLIAFAAALIGALAGGHVGRAMGPGTITTGERADEHELRSGDYLTVEGKLMALERFEHANAVRFVTNSTVHGQSAVGPPWRHSDPDEWLIPDPCQVIVVE